MAKRKNKTASRRARRARPKPFRFLDLPREVRENVYENLLHIPKLPEQTWNERDPTKRPVELPTLKGHIETQTLRACRSVNAEADYILRKTNLFIKLTVTSERVNIFLHHLIIAKRLPILRLSSKTAQDFKPFVMSHELSLGPPNALYTIIILQRDLELLCRIIMYSANISHDVNLVNPYTKGASDSGAFSLPIQGMIVAPYRRILKAIPNFIIGGAIDRNLKAATVLDVTTPFPADPEKILQPLEQSIAKGMAELAKGNSSKASSYLSEVEFTMNRIEGTRPLWDNLQEAGGVEFVNKMAELRFTQNSNRVRIFVKEICQVTELHQSQHVIPMHGIMMEILGDARFWRQRYPSSTWSPSTQQLGQLYHHEAILSRLAVRYARPESDAQIYFDRADAAIRRARELMPTQEVLTEFERVRVSLIDSRQEMIWGYFWCVRRVWLVLLRIFGA